MRLPRWRFLIVALLLLVGVPSFVWGDEVSDLDQRFRELQQQIEQEQKARESAQQRLEKAKQEEQAYRGSLNQYENSYATTREKLQATTAALQEKAKQIDQIVAALDEITTSVKRREELLNLAVRALYMQDQGSGLELFLMADSFARLTKTIVYRDAVIGEYKRQILQLKAQIKILTQDKAKLEELKVQLEADQEQLSKQEAVLASSINQARQSISAAQAEQQRLQQDLIGIDNSLSELTQAQREILAAKAAAALASTTVGDEEIRRAAIEKPPPEDGQTYFSFWTYGYPHRVGMSQYGAYGRAKAGQTAEEILKAYYTGVEVADYAVPETIQIEKDGQKQTLNFEDEYLMGIGEMPSCWGKPENGGFEALKAQAIAARTYALSYTNNGRNSICTDQNCQVYVGMSKIQGECGSYWQEAVKQTRGKVIMSDGKVIAAWYHSTAGGFTLSAAQVWGGARSFAQGIADLDEKGFAYDGPEHGNSPWYYKAWGNEPWLSKAEVADLFNAALLPEEFNSRLAAQEKGGLSPQQIVKKLRDLSIEPVENLQAVAISGDDTAETDRVVALYGSDEIESVSVSAKRFRYVYNLRAPGTDAIWTTRFNVKSSQ